MVEEAINRVLRKWHGREIHEKTISIQKINLRESRRKRK